MMNDIVVAGVLVASLVFVSCATTDPGPDGDRTPRRVSELGGPDGGVDLRFAQGSGEAKTIQLYRGDDETSLPVIALGSSDRLNLEFDILSDDSRPLSIYFYHADKDWQRDLTPAEYLESFQRDDLLDYTPSHQTEINFTHYRYSFPNQSIRFVVSGNYILRVTEQGREEAVLFEQPFFVTEQLSEVQLALDNVILSGYSSPGVQPFALFTPPSSTEANVFSYTVCFTQNGAFESSRCTDQPSLMKQPALEFYLRPSSVFPPTSADYFLDLSLLQTGNRIEIIDRVESPYRVVLEPDLARLGASGLGPVLNRQIAVSGVVRDAPEPDLSAQYVDVLFRFVPEGGRKYQTDVFVTGSFNQWSPGPESKLTWVPEEGRYEGSVVMKQGMYEYRYTTNSSAVNARLRRGIPSTSTTYMAFVYYDDITLQTDRLIATGGSAWRR